MAEEWNLAALWSLSPLRGGEVWREGAAPQAPCFYHHHPAVPDFGRCAATRAAPAALQSGLRGTGLLEG